MKKQFKSAINPSPLFKLTRDEVAKILRSNRNGSFKGIVKKTSKGYTINARLAFEIV